MPKWTYRKKKTKHQPLFYERKHKVKTNEQNKNKTKQDDNHNKIKIEIYINCPLKNYPELHFLSLPPSLDLCREASRRSGARRPNST